MLNKLRTDSGLAATGTTTRFPVSLQSTKEQEPKLSE